MLPWVADQTVERLRPGTSSNGYDDVREDWSVTPTPLTIEGCSVQPETGQELVDGRTVTVTRQRWFGPYDPEVKSSDRLRHNGTVYKVKGSVERWADPTGAGLDHQTCLMEVVS